MNSTSCARVRNDHVCSTSVKPSGRYLLEEARHTDVDGGPGSATTQFPDRAQLCKMSAKPSTTASQRLSCGIAPPATVCGPCVLSKCFIVYACTTAKAPQGPPSA